MCPWRNSDPHGGVNVTIAIDQNHLLELRENTHQALMLAIALKHDESLDPMTRHVVQDLLQSIQGAHNLATRLLHRPTVYSRE